MRRSPSAVAAAVLLGGPVALAFASGGYFDGPRLTALLIAAGVLLLVALSPSGAGLLPRADGGRIALVALWLLAGWVALSRGRSPVPDVAGDDAERVVLYAGVLLAGAVAWRERAAARLAEPLVAAGVLLVIGYGLAGRWLPGLLELSASRSAGGRLEQPLTYWNATGFLAAFGAVLCVRIAGDRDRPQALAAGAAAGVVPLLCGVYLSFSRGAVAALVAGVLVLVLCAPTRSQLRALALALATGLAAVVASGLLPGVRALEGTSRASDGLIALLVTLVAMAAAAVLALRVRRRDSEPEPVRIPRWVRPAAAVAIVLAVVVPVVLGEHGQTKGQAGFGASTQRFTNVNSNRYDYWRVALRTFADHPIEGVGSGGWGTEWLRERPIAEAARDAHSLELETLAELGLAGLVLLLPLLAGVGACAVRLQARDPQLAAGPCAALTVWLAHTALDWDWEMPAATLPALTLAGVVIARAAPDRPPRDTGARPLGRVVLMAAAVVCAVVALTARHGDRKCESAKAEARAFAATPATGDAAGVWERGLDACADPQQALDIIAAVFARDQNAAIEGVRALSRRDPVNWVVWLARSRLERDPAQVRAARAEVRTLNPRFDQPVPSP